MTSLLFLNETLKYLPPKDQNTLSKVLSEKHLLIKSKICILLESINFEQFKKHYKDNKYLKTLANAYNISYDSSIIKPYLENLNILNWEINCVNNEKELCYDLVSNIYKAKRLFGKNYLMALKELNVHISLIPSSHTNILIMILNEIITAQANNLRKIIFSFGYNKSVRISKCSFYKEISLEKSNNITDSIIIIPDNTCFSQLVEFNMTIPMIIGKNIKMPKIEIVNFVILPDPQISSWHNTFGVLQKFSDLPSNEPIRKSHSYLYNLQYENLKNLIQCISRTVKKLTLIGDISIRAKCLFWTSFMYPALEYFDLGWITGEELNKISIMLNNFEQHIGTSIENIHNAPEYISEFELRMLKNSITKAKLSYKSKLPNIKTIKFRGPLNVGLSKNHLKIYENIVKINTKNIIEKFGTISVEFDDIVNFRCKLLDYPYFYIFKHSVSTLVILLCIHKNSCTNIPANTNKLYGLSIEQLFLNFIHITAEQSCYHNARMYYINRRKKSIINTSLNCHLPNISTSMSAKDLFAAEFWQFTTIDQKYAQSPKMTVYELWDQVSDSVKSKYNILVKNYIKARLDHNYSFDKYRPWWETNS